jgi:hypothetical protein
MAKLHYASTVPLLWKSRYLNNVMIYALVGWLMQMRKRPTCTCVNVHIYERIYATWIMTNPTLVLILTPLLGKCHARENVCLRPCWMRGIKSSFCVLTGLHYFKPDARKLRPFRDGLCRSCKWWFLVLSLPYWFQIE